MHKQHDRTIQVNFSVTKLKVRTFKGTPANVTFMDYLINIDSCRRDVIFKRLNSMENPSTRRTPLFCTAMQCG